MSSYKKHAIFALILTLPFFPNVFSLALAVIGASFPDFDHRLKMKNISLLFIIGSITTCLFYIFKLPYLLGIILITLAIIFYLSEHRGFTHSLLGIFLLSIILTVLVVSSYYFFFFDLGLKQQGTLAVILIILGSLTINRNIILPFIFIGVLGVLLTPFPGLDLYKVLGAFLLGFISHVILDSFTPSGVEFLRPFYKKRFKKGFGILFIVLWLLGASYYIINFGFNVIR
jgi:inner membrane protein